MPISKEEAASFQENVLVIGRLDGRYMRYIQHESQACCFVGLKYSEYEDNRVEKVDKVDCWCVDGDDENAQDMSYKAEGWTKYDGDYICLGLLGGNVLVHTQCWELLHSVCKSRCIKPVTPKLFLTGVSTAYYDNKKKEEAEFFSSRSCAPGTALPPHLEWMMNPSVIPGHEWPLDFIAYDGSDQWVDPLAPLDDDFKDALMTAIELSQRTGKIDVNLRQELWSQMRAWLWHPIDR